MERDLLSRLKKKLYRYNFGTVSTDMVLFQPIDRKVWIQDRWLQKVKKKQDNYLNFSYIKKSYLQYRTCYLQFNNFKWTDQVVDPEPVTP